ncbi:MAG: hypothetical protein M0C28_22725 [Candidatus Moduliflexus flocculans]|nr:hypothetical protein [Candidatus Moduliflexus flocculans]
MADALITGVIQFHEGSLLRGRHHRGAGAGDRELVIGQWPIMSSRRRSASARFVDLSSRHAP